MPHVAFEVDDLDAELAGHEILIAPKTPPVSNGPDGKPLPPSQADTDAALAAAQTKAQDILAQLQKGASFEEVAKKNSDGPSAKDGGDLSYFKRGVLAPMFAQRSGRARSERDAS